MSATHNVEAWSQIWGVIQERENVIKVREFDDTVSCRQ